jgi:hypothetical protein
MKTRRWVLAGVIATMVLPAGRAEPSPQAMIEIDYLLGLVGSARCEFNRNGTWYGSTRAQEHLRSKYEYLAAHGRVVTAEEFIERAATKSSRSGQPYLLRCGGGKVVTSESWLRAALARYRVTAAH